MQQQGLKQHLAAAMQHKQQLSHVQQGPQQHDLGKKAVFTGNRFEAGRQDLSLKKQTTPAKRPGAAAKIWMC